MYLKKDRQILTPSDLCCNRDHFAETDTFSFHRGHLINVPYRYRPGNKDKEPTGFLSLSRSPYSLVWTVGINIFTYNISYSKSSFTIGYEANTTALQSTKILTNPSHPDFYYVNLTQISIGNASYKIDPTSNSSNVILDTVITPTLLETSVYAKVKTELKKLGQSFMDDDNELELCFSNKPSWPNLTLFFPSGSSFSASAQMVLTPDCYVVTIEKTKAQCAAIFETEGASVIGIMAQINRKMVFDLSTSEPMLYFSKCPSHGPIAVPSMIMILILSLSVLLYLYFPV
jgi:Xylanase inhibitor C-terminal